MTGFPTKNKIRRSQTCCHSAPSKTPITETRSGVRADHAQQRPLVTHTLIFNSKVPMKWHRHSLATIHGLSGIKTATLVTGHRRICSPWIFRGHKCTSTHLPMPSRASSPKLFKRRRRWWPTVRILWQRLPSVKQSPKVLRNSLSLRRKLPPLHLLNQPHPRTLPAQEGPSRACQRSTLSLRPRRSTKARSPANGLLISLSSGMPLPISTFLRLPFFPYPDHLSF